jgi:hypothetical protein
MFTPSDALEVTHPMVDRTPLLGKVKDEAGELGVVNADDPDVQHPLVLGILLQLRRSLYPQHLQPAWYLRLCLAFPDDPVFLPPIQLGTQYGRYSTDGPTRARM